MCPMYCVQVVMTQLSRRHQGTIALLAIGYRHCGAAIDVSGCWNNSKVARSGLRLASSKFPSSSQTNCTCVFAVAPALTLGSRHTSHLRATLNEDQEIRDQDMEPQILRFGGSTPPRLNE